MEPSDRQAFGHRLEAARIEQGLDIEDVVQAAGVSRPTVVKALRGEKVRPQTLTKIARALGLKPPGESIRSDELDAMTLKEWDELEREDPAMAENLRALARAHLEKIRRERSGG